MPSSVWKLTNVVSGFVDGSLLPRWSTMLRSLVSGALYRLNEIDSCVIASSGSSGCGMAVSSGQRTISPSKLSTRVGGMSSRSAVRTLASEQITSVDACVSRDVGTLYDLTSTQLPGLIDTASKKRNVSSNFRSIGSNPRTRQQRVRHAAIVGSVTT